jgi:hypothetical protein
MSYRTTVTHFDTAMALIEVGSLRLLTDPFFDHAGSGFDHGPVHHDGWRHFTEARNVAELVFERSPIADRLTWLQRGSPVAFALKARNVDTIANYLTPT